MLPSGLTLRPGGHVLVIAVDGVVGVNLSGLASGRGERVGAEIKAAIGAEVLAA